MKMGSVHRTLKGAASSPRLQIRAPNFHSNDSNKEPLCRKMSLTQKTPWNW